MYSICSLRHKGVFVVSKEWEWVFLRRYKTFLLGSLLSILFVNCAKADFRVCNTTQQPVGVAIGYRAFSGWVSEGWWVIPDAGCKTLIEGALSSRFYYFYAEGAQKKGGWLGPVTMCVQDSQFVIQGVHDCFARGFQKAGFKEIDTGNQTSWIVQLTDKSLFDDSVLHSSAFPGVSPP
ncbi:DUF1036 domain-containing protein [Bartonella sp. CB178]|uniref:DUF1036 domain-containing protein n=1 Tax=Bartonella sp. CB178 TaxID=3112255 RepID=UPI003FA596A3